MVTQVLAQKLLIFHFLDVFVAVLVRDSGGNKLD